MCQEAYWQVNKAIARSIGGRAGRDAALLLADLLSKEYYYATRGELRDDDYFYNSQEAIERDTTMSPYEQQKIIHVLEHHRLITTKIAKAGYNGATLKHFKIHHSRILKILDSGIEKILIPEPKGLKTNNNKGIENKGMRDTTYPSNAPAGAPVVDDTPAKKMTRTKEAPEPCDYVEHWNAQDCTPKHKDPGANVYKEAARRCGQLENGILSRACVIDPAWAERNKVPVEMMRRKWTPDEIREGIRRLALVYKEGYWPYNKKGLRRSLSEMIYNPKSKSSWFLRVMANEPLPIADTAAPLDETAHAMYRRLFKGTTLSDAEEAKLVKMVNLLVGKQREIAKHLEPYLGHTSFSGKFGSRNNRFFQTHIDWLTSWCEDIRVETVWKTWGAFVRWARDFHKMEIEPSNDNVRHAKQAHARAEEERKRREAGAERARLEHLAGVV